MSSSFLYLSVAFVSAFAVLTFLLESRNMSKTICRWLHKDSEKACIVVRIILGVVIIVSAISTFYLADVFFLQDLEPDMKNPVKVIKEYEPPAEYTESPFDYESEIEGKVVEVSGTVTAVGKGLVVKSLSSVDVEVSSITVNDNIVCDVQECNVSGKDIENAQVVLRGVVVSEGSVLELKDCDVKVVSEKIGGSSKSK